MTSMQEKASSSSATDRAEQLLNQAGERLGTLVGRTIVGFRRGIQSLSAEADQLDVPEPASEKRRARKTDSRKDRANSLAMERAEELVDQAGQRAGQWMEVNGLRMRRALAFAREEIEDIWVDAREVRREWQNELNQRSSRPPSS